MHRLNLLRRRKSVFKKLRKKARLKSVAELLEARRRRRFKLSQAKNDNYAPGSKPKALKRARRFKFDEMRLSGRWTHGGVENENNYPGAINTKWAWQAFVVVGHKVIWMFGENSLTNAKMRVAALVQQGTLIPRTRVILGNGTMSHSTTVPHLSVAYGEFTRTVLRWKTRKLQYPFDP
jgi:hypothetical protein